MSLRVAALWPQRWWFYCEGEPVIEEFANLRVDGALQLELVPALPDPGKDHAPVIQFIEVMAAE